MKKHNRRDFLKIATAGGIAATLAPSISFSVLAQDSPKNPETNIKDALNYPRTETSMPGKYPGKVIQLNNPMAIKDNKFDYEQIFKTLSMGMLELTKTKSHKDAWRQFVSPEDIIGLNVNPVAGITLSTSPEVVRAIIAQLVESGIPKKNIVIYDRREGQLYEAGFTKENFPDIKIFGVERQDEKGSFFNSENKLYSEDLIDKEWYFWANVDGKYDKDTLPYMVNEGEYSYFHKVVTKEFTKIINVPILKNAGATVTLCMKNLAYGVITNTGRLHKELWNETCAQVCAFPPVRDKVVLNIVDGFKGCFNGGPGANPQFFTNYNTMLIGTDAVAVDRIGHDIVVKKRIEEKLQKADSDKSRKFLTMASELGLGVSDIEKISLKSINV